MPHCAICETTIVKWPKRSGCALNQGLSGPGRLHDLTVLLEAASPGEIKSGGKGWEIKAGFCDSPFGKIARNSTEIGLSQQNG